MPRDCPCGATGPLCKSKVQPKTAVQCQRRARLFHSKCVAKCKEIGNLGVATVVDACPFCRGWTLSAPEEQQPEGGAAAAQGGAATVCHC